jgi:hypothetical protein
MISTNILKFQFLFQGLEREETGVYVGTGISFALNLESKYVYTPVALQ